MGNQYNTSHIAYYSIRYVCLFILAYFADVYCQILFCQYCRALANFAEVWPILQSFAQFCRALPNIAELWPNLQSFGQIDA